jgi:signal transduction histidine kinase
LSETGRSVGGGWWIAAGIAVAGGLSLAVVRWDIAERRSAFQAEARTAHRLLSQGAAQHDAMLWTLVLLDAPAGGGADLPAARLQALYPQLLQVWRRGPGGRWPDATLDAAERSSRGLHHAVASAVDDPGAAYVLVLAGEPASYALQIDLQRWLPWDSWPIARGGPVRVDIELQGRRLNLQAGAAAGGWAGGVTPGFVFAQALDVPSQPFALRLQRVTGPADWPWAVLAAIVVGTAVLFSLAAAGQQQRRRRRRAEALLRLTRTARLNALGSLSAGLAHELNQPLTAVLASTQAARRLLDDEPLPTATLQEALGHAAAQARRAAEVVARLRRLVEQPGDAARGVELRALVLQVLGLLQPECARLGVRVNVGGEALRVQADPVALEQIVHNLATNALQALEAVPAQRRSLQILLAAEDGRGVLSLADSGPGLSAEVLAHLFEPFNSQRPGGLGLGLSLCESLASGMGGRLSGQNAAAGGAVFRLTLPLATDP